jgi:hypothetical protein
MKVDVNFDAMIEEVEVEVEAVVDPGYPAPHCQDPSSPAYSDCGDPGCVDEIKVYLTRTPKRGKKIFLDITDFIDTDDLENEAFERLADIEE